MRVRPREPADETFVELFLSDQYSLRVARLGELVDARDHPALVAERDGRIVGVLTYIPAPERWEVLTLHAAERLRGIGSALIERVVELAVEQGAKRLFLITTNDNVDALRFYQRRGFELVALHRGSVDRSRERFKPEIPRVGEHGIPLRDELELERAL